MPLPDPTRDAALEHLRIIRTLMERAHIYRAVSAPAALCGGLMALVLSGYGIFRGATTSGGSFQGMEFLSWWLAVLVIATGLNFALLMRESKGQGQPFVTDGMRMAFRAFFPPMLTGGVLGICLILSKAEQMPLAALVWILCYALALLGTSSFAPLSIVRLGWAFLLTGILLTLLWFAKGGSISQPTESASSFLGLTFGLFHIVYAIAVFNTRAKGFESPAVNAP